MMEERMARVGERERVKLNGSNILPFLLHFCQAPPPPHSHPYHSLQVC